MKLNVVTKGHRLLIDVEVFFTIWQIKKMVADILYIKISPPRKDSMDDEEGAHCDYIHLYLQRTPLHNDCTVGEIGIKSGATLRCEHMRRKLFDIKILVPCLSTELELNEEEFSFYKTTIGDLKGVLQSKLGLPVSTFRLQKMHNSRLLFDNHLLSYYDIARGDTLVLEVFDEIEELVAAALSGDISSTISQLPSLNVNPNLNRYCLRVVLFIASHTDEVNLAPQMLQRGVRCYDPVSVHPSRQWCVQQSHIDAFKTPVHHAALRGSFRTLSMFLRHSPTSISAKDGNGVRASTYAMKYHHIECWKLLTLAYFQFHNAYGFSLTIHSKLLSWCDRAKDRVLFLKAMKKRKRSVDKFCSIREFSLGGPIVINGYHDKQEDEEAVDKATSAWSSKSLQYQFESLRLRRHSLSSMTHKNWVKRADAEFKSEISGTEFPSPQTVTCKSGLHHSNPSCTAPPYQCKGRRNRVSSTHLQARLEAQRIIVNKTGKMPAEIASQCFDMGQTFENMKWGSQMKLALKCSMNCIENKRHFKK